MVKQICQGRLVSFAIIVVAMVLLPSVISFAALYDPMRPQVATSVAAVQKVAADEFHLEAIVVSDQRRVAVIDGKNLNVGDSYKGFRVKSIVQTGVTLTGSGEQRCLTLQPTIVTIR
ncbi:MAG: hypothetical protein U9R29_03405 [Thermodesulfobacteriota bacterium]|nr:hypothetical protein [Thermodesulfobacteriota bacterium]